MQWWRILPKGEIVLWQLHDSLLGNRNMNIEVKINMFTAIIFHQYLTPEPLQVQDPIYLPFFFSSQKMNLAAHSRELCVSRKDFLANPLRFRVTFFLLCNDFNRSSSGGCRWEQSYDCQILCVKEFFQNPIFFLWHFKIMSVFKPFACKTQNWRKIDVRSLNAFKIFFSLLRSMRKPSTDSKLSLFVWSAISFSRKTSGTFEIGVTMLTKLSGGFSSQTKSQSKKVPVLAH